MCLDVLCAYLRMPYETDIASEKHLEGEREVRQTIIRIIRDPSCPTSWCGRDLDFTNATFDGGSFDGAKFIGGGASFYGAKFADCAVFFSGAEFTGVTISFDNAEFISGTVSFEGSVFTDGVVSFSVQNSLAARPPSSAQG
jgi:Pentapeptide repeats (9 copies)